MAKKSAPLKTASRKKPAPRSTKKAQSKSQEDIIELILQHHKPLKKLIKILKSEKDFTEKAPAFQEFAPLLISHAKPEEKVLYVAMKKIEDLRAEGFEGDTEHGLADQLVEEIKRTDDEDLWMAKVKVLAELVEHHIEEEEEDMLPDYKKESDLEERIKLGKLYMRLREEMLDQEGDDAPSERNRSSEKSESSYF